MTEIEILKHFLEYPIWTSKPIFEKFKTIDTAIFKEQNEKSKQRFLFIEGKCENKVVLIAHADTFFDEFYGYAQQDHFVEIQDNCFVGKTDVGERIALGADDRAGCAILWALRNSGHSILITDGEEQGRIGSNWLMDENSDIAKIINNHQFMIQFDRRNGTDFKCYDVGSDEFREFISSKTGYSEPDRRFYTDICTLCRNICGVNLSIVYYDEHSYQERINISEWLYTLKLMKEFLQDDLPGFKKKYG